MPEHIVVIGAGLAGGSAVTALREGGHTGPITLLGTEERVPYERPPLSKGYLMGESSFEEAQVHDADWYPKNEVDLRTGTTATGLDLANRTVQTTGGDVTYDKLLLATGASPRHLALADDSGVPTAYLRNVEDSNQIREQFGEGKKIVIIGAGWIGLEVASAARKVGTEVTIFERAAQPLLPVLGPEVAARFAAVHRAHGVDLRLDTEVTAEDLAGADLVVVGIGAIPNTQLAEDAGLDVDHGVLVDATLRTSDPDVYAVGDIANQDHPTLGRVRVEHWDTAIEQAKVVARNLLGAQQDYDRQPYFFTDQYDLGMEYFGRGSGSDRVITRGDLGDGSGTFRAYWVRDGLVVAAMHANDWDASDELRDSVGTDAAQVEDQDG
ncbi:MAG: FAD/NAD(P)-binding oxidoreductase [Ornithinimicrobium sp.]|uniref:NAD(P)/FAD-dependent oxidoreductase n=1 Tax=Ornithinimicrobium sp. TaxID=1977084 RepID=UPI0026DEB824|nr:FAD/NAD(P)-binding oxidoreductase [Ornithinimicrobium sp.]MDO5739747.1 FAD/NAD(P)-binding oxidoreductase [Ornithinimicrobium sp.]